MHNVRSTLLLELGLRGEVVLHEAVCLSPDHVVQQPQSLDALDADVELVLHDVLLHARVVPQVSFLGYQVLPGRNNILVILSYFAKPDEEMFFFFLLYFLFKKLVMHVYFYKLDAVLWAFFFKTHFVLFLFVIYLTFRYCKDDKRYSYHQ